MAVKSEGGRLLALTSVLPPLVYPRALQIARLLKSLGELGWRTDVVTVAADADPTALRDERLADFYNGCYTVLALETRENICPSPLLTRWGRRLRKVQDVDLENWRDRSLRLLRERLSATNYDAVVTFAQPWVNFSIGLKLKKSKPDIFWVVHFSDPWVDSSYANYTSDEQFDAARAEEEQVVAAADMILFVNQRTADLVMAKYPFHLRTKVRILPHSFDSGLKSLLPHRPHPENASKMRIVHTGNFYGSRTPETFVKALSLLRKSGRLSSCSLEVEFVGFCEEGALKRLDKLIASEGLGEIIRFTGLVDYITALASADTADLLLVIDAPAAQSVFFPSKLVDYLMFDKPIFAITPDHGCTADLAAAFGFRQVGPENPESIAEALSEEIRLWQGDERSRPLHKSIAQLESRKAADLLIRHLRSRQGSDSLCAEN